MSKFPIIEPNISRAIYLVKRQLSEFVTDAVNLEGINITLPEVQTLLDGVTIGGHKISDVTIALNQANAWKFLFNSIEQNTFKIDKDFSNKVHFILAKEKFLECSGFRDGNVTIVGTSFIPPKSDKLNDCWNKMINEIQGIDNIIEKAIVIFLQMVRNKFYFDLNKRIGLFIMNGFLLKEGYPAINVPFKRQLEFNQLMLEFYPSNDMSFMIDFMVSCVNQRDVDFINKNLSSEFRN